jgi:hypothetical protein
VTHLDLSTHQEHGCGSADGGGVECLQVVDHVSDGINALKRKEDGVRCEVCGEVSGEKELRCEVQMKEHVKVEATSVRYMGFTTMYCTVQYSAVHHCTARR